MKTILLSQQLVHFRNIGHLRLENTPFEFKTVRTIAKNQPCPRDIWRQVPQLKKMILQEFGPLGLELINKTFARLACDHFFEETPKVQTFKELFCFQNLACIFVLTEDENKQTNLDIFEPSNLVSKISYPAYVVAFAYDNAVIIENPKDPYSIQTRNLGYVYGDRLQNPYHPLISKR